jgi:hypothetical protein
MQGSTEEALVCKPIVVEFPGPNAGHIYKEEALTANQQYMHMLRNDIHNPYMPFSLHKDWEIAKWAKCQGVSSTAFTDLMKIEGVSHQLSSVTHVRIIH